MRKRELPPLDTLPAFAVAAHELSFTRAAAALHLTQSAVSRQIQALEIALGVALFERRHRALALTVAGSRYARDVEAALDALREATAAVRKPQRDGVLTIATTLSFASLWLVPRLADFQAAHPGLDVRVAADNRVQNLEREGIDLALRYASVGAVPPGSWRMFGEQVLPVAAPALLARALAHPRELLDQPMLHFEDPDHEQPWLSWRVWFELAGVDLQRERPRARALHFTVYPQVIDAAIDGQGVALGRTGLVERHLRAGRLVAPFGKRYVSAGDRTRAYYLVVNPRTRSLPAVAAFRRWLERQVGEPKEDA